MFTLYKEKIFFPWMGKNIGTEEINRLRKMTINKAWGNVLEIGFGTGLNLNYYTRDVLSITAVDTSFSGQRKFIDESLPLKLMVMSAEKLDFAANSFDTVVSTFTLCSVPHLDRVLREIYRVLKPEGQLLFLEHGKSWKMSAAVIQNISNPLYQVFACGCNVNRSYEPLILKEGFKLKTLDKIRVKSLMIAGYLYAGTAVKQSQPALEQR